MSGAIGLIVDGLVYLKDRGALEEMREHRQRLRELLLQNRKGAFDPGKSLQLFDDEIAVIEMGLHRLATG